MSHSQSHNLTHATPLPTLSATDTTLLTLYLTEVNTHLPAFAIKSNLGMIAAIAFLARPDIASYIANFHRLRESTQRMIALNYLREIVEVSEDPIEQRRAASTLLRALGHAARRTDTPTPPPAPTTPTPNPTPPAPRADAPAPLHSQHDLTAPRPHTPQPHPVLPHATPSHPSRLSVPHLPAPLDADNSS